MIKITMKNKFRCNILLATSIIISRCYINHVPLIYSSNVLSKISGQKICCRALDIRLGQHICKYPSICQRHNPFSRHGTGVTSLVDKPMVKRDESLTCGFIVTQSQVPQNIEASRCMVWFYSYPSVLCIHWVEQDCGGNPSLQLIVTQTRAT
jgi:hypothetical protein